MSRKVLKGGFVVSMDESIGNLPKADVLIDGDTILDIAPDLNVEDAEVFDARNAIVMPGLIDTHRHVWQGAIRSVTGDWSLNDYFRGIRMNAATAYSPEDMYAVQLHGALEALNAGVTTVCDYSHNLNSPDHAFETLRGLRDGGVRVVWAYGFNRPPLEDRHFKSTADRAEFARTIAKEHFSGRSGLMTMAIAPEESSFWRHDPSRILAQFTVARELDIPVFWHCNSSTDRQTGQHLRDVSRLRELGLLGQKLVLVHASRTDADEWSMIADSGAGISLTPDTEMQMGMGWSPTEMARLFKIPQSYGADIISNNTGDMFAALRLGLQTARCQKHEREYGEKLTEGALIPASEALAWGTIDAARAIGMESKIGSLVPGKQADVLIIPTDTLSLVGWDKTNPAATLVLQAHGSDVKSVLVAGEFVKKNGNMIGDSRRAIELLQAAHERVTTQVNARGGFLQKSMTKMFENVQSIRDQG